MCVCEFPVRMRAWKWRQMVKFPHKERERERETLIQMEDSSRDPRGGCFSSDACAIWRVPRGRGFIC